MKYISLTLIIFQFIVVNPSFGAGSQGSAAGSNYQNPNDTKGLCTDDNKEEEYMQVGLCLSLWRALNSGCTKDLVEKIRKRIIDEDGKQDYFDLGFYCGSEAKGGKKSRSLSEIAKDPQQFTFLLVQFFAAVAGKTSGWDVLANQDEAGQTPSMDKKQGVFNLSTNNMMKSEYKCGCQDLNEACPNGQQGPGEVRDESIESNSCPGAIDGHHSMSCGAYMALYHADKDGTLFGGKTKQGGAGKSDGGDDQGPKGAARIWKVLEDDNKDVGAQKDPNDADEAPTTKGFIRKKMKAFCKGDGAAKIKDMLGNNEDWQHSFENARGLKDLGSGTTTK